MNDNDQLDEMPGANMNTRDVHQHLKKRGWSLSRTSGGHDVYTHTKSDKHIAVPRHKQLKAPLVMGILKTAKMVSEENDTVEKNQMAQTQLHFIEYAVKEINDYISMGGQIEEWYQNKLSKVHSDMEGLHAYMEGEKRRTGMVSEDVEQIDELSKSTLGSYAKRASYDSVTRGMKYGEKMDQSGSNKKELNKLNKRESGVQKAIDRLTKKSVNEGENDQMKSDDPCWKGYQMVGMKKKGGKDVPNCVPVKEDFEQLEEGRPSQRHPLEDHEYHRKSNDELIRIAKDAHKAAEAMKSHNTTAENKYRDQANDSATVRYFRQKNGMPTWYKKKYGHMNEEFESEITNESDAAWEKAKDKEKRDALTSKDRGTLDRVRAMMAKEKKPVQEQHRDVGRFVPVIPHEVKNVAGVSPRKKSDSANVELDEISKRTLGSYIKKANDQSRYDANRVGYVAGKSTKPYNDSEESSLEKKRATGIAKATDRLTKEDIDQIDEGAYKRMATDAEEDKRLSPGSVTDKSGAVHSPMSRVKHLAKMAMKKQADAMKKPVSEESDKSRKSEIVRDAVKSAKTKNEKKVNSNKTDKFEADPVLGDSITRTDQ